LQRPHTHTACFAPLAVGWLEPCAPFPTGQTTDAFRKQLRALAANPIFLTRGFHRCPWCPLDAGNDDHSGNGEFCIKGPNGRWYCAPQLIAHYVDDHNYLPPGEFIEAVCELAAIHDGHSGWHVVSERDRSIIELSLGRKPTGIHQVAARSPAGNPVVIANNPVQARGYRHEPFPTFYWLVDAELNALIADIERRGGVSQIEAQLNTADHLMQEHLADNQAYADARWAALSVDDIRLAKKHRFVEVLTKSGIGGVSNHRAVKCLHTQYAFHLARHGYGTAVGKMMQQQYGELGRTRA